MGLPRPSVKAERECQRLYLQSDCDRHGSKVVIYHFKTRESSVPLAACRWQHCLRNETEGKGGTEFIGYYLEGQQELHTGHSSSLATWSEARRQLVEPSRKTQILRSTSLTPTTTSYMLVHMLSPCTVCLSHT